MVRPTEHQRPDHISAGILRSVNRQLMVSKATTGGTTDVVQAALDVVRRVISERANQSDNGCSFCASSFLTSLQSEIGAILLALKSLMQYELKMIDRLDSCLALQDIRYWTSSKTEIYIVLRENFRRKRKKKYLKNNRVGRRNIFQICLRQGWDELSGRQRKEFYNEVLARSNYFSFQP